MLAVGIKMNVGANLCSKLDMPFYIENAILELDPIIGIDQKKNPATATHYDVRTGDIIFHFAFLVDAEDLQLFFKESEIIFKIQN